MGRLLGGLAGAGFFIWIAGTRALDPGEIGWLMRYDWPVHFFGWHFFRSESWHWPPGLITTYYAPAGTAIGFTDSIPLAAFLLKPFGKWLPATFQYLGPWLLLCFVLQGVFGAWLASRWTPRPSLQLCVAALFVLVPTLLARIGHPSLCAHWLLLWVLVMATRDSAPARVRWPEWALLGWLAGWLHPYLAAMVLALCGAIVLMPAVPALSWQRRGGAMAAAVIATVMAWWTAGLFSVSGAGSMATEGLGYYSMNLLAPVSPTGWSAFLPDVPRATPGQDFEGFHYLGLGTLLALGLALWLRRRAPRSVGGTGLAPALWLVALALGVFALSPRVTAGSFVLVDASGPWTAGLAVFRATGRFFWPLGYLLLAWAAGVIITRLPSRAALMVLTTVVIVQAVDLHGVHEERRDTARDPGFHTWTHPMMSPAWHDVLPAYRHLVLYPPPQCGQAPVPYEAAAWLAGLHGLSLNTGGVARPDEAARDRYCRGLGDQVKAGALDDDSVYIMPEGEVEAVRAASPRVVCGRLDTVHVCVTTATADRWRAHAALR